MGGDDLEDVNRHTVPEHLVEPLLDRTLAQEAVPAALTEVDRLLGALRAPGSDAELAGSDDVLAAFRAAAQAPATVLPLEPVAQRRRHRTAKVIGIAAFATLSVSAAAAAATGRLPVVQHSRPADTTTAASTSAAVSTTTASVAAAATPPAPPTSHAVDSTVPGTVSAAAPAVSDPPASTPVGPDATDPAHRGLCTAYQTQTDQPGTRLDATAFQKLTEAATAAGQTVEEFCADVTTPPTSSPSDTAPGQSGDSPSDTAPGQSGDSPSATAPGQSGENPGTTAPGQTGENPGTTAPGQTGENPGATAPGQNDATASPAPAAPSETTPAGPPADVPGETAPGKTGDTPGATAPGATTDGAANGQGKPADAGRPTG